MIRSLSYPVGSLTDYINWIYFFHAWGFAARFATIASVHSCVACRQAWFATFADDERLQAEEAARLYDEALALLSLWEGVYEVRARFALCEAWSEEDDVVVHLQQKERRIPFLRQQIPTRHGEPHLCWADFIAPKEKNGPHCLGIFAACVPAEMERLYADDDYRSMLARTLCDRLAEAAAEKMHEEVRRTHWGYAAAESLAPQELFAEKYVGRRPAVGYPSLPDQSLTFLLDELMDFSAIGLRLTENGMMQPHAAVCGLMFSHPAARHFAVGRIDREQLADYAARRGMDEAAMAKFLAANLSYNTVV